MARPKTKSALVEGIIELVDSLRNIESQLRLLMKNSKGQKSSGRGPGRPAGSGRKRKPGRPASGRGPGRPPGKRRGRPAKAKRGRPGRPPGKAKRGPGRPSGKRRGRPAGSKNKK